MCPFFFKKMVDRKIKLIIYNRDDCDSIYNWMNVIVLIKCCQFRFSIMTQFGLYLNNEYFFKNQIVL